MTTRDSLKSFKFRLRGRHQDRSYLKLWAAQCGHSKHTLLQLAPQ